VSVRFYNPRAYYTDESGEPLAGGKLYFYLSGTSTPTGTWADAELVNLNSNPIILDSAGRLPNDVFLDPDVTYKVVLKASNDVTIWTADPVNDPNAESIVSLETRLTTAEGNITANASAVQSLDTRVDVAEGDITAQATSITALEASVTALDTQVTGNATAITALDTRVTTAEGNITSQASSITTLQSNVTDLQADVSGNATAISGLQTDVTALDGEVTSLSTSFTTVFASNGVGDTSAMFRMVAVAAPTGYDASIQLQAKVEGDTFAASRAVMEMDVGAGIGSRIRFIADRLVFASEPGALGTIVPFAEFSASKIRFSTDVEIDGDLLLTGSVATAGIAANAVTDSVDAYTAAQASPTSDVTWTDAQSVTLTIGTGEKAILMAAATWFDYYVVANGNRFGLEVRFLRDSTEIQAAIEISPSSTSATQSNEGIFAWTVVDEPSAGTYTYKMQIKRVSSAGNSVGMKHRTLVGLRAKR
jgi:uncharacterized coiled-coil protein SlyX